METLLSMFPNSHANQQQQQPNEQPKPEYDSYFNDDLLDEFLDTRIYDQNQQNQQPQQQQQQQNDHQQLQTQTQTQTQTPISNQAQILSPPSGAAFIAGMDDYMFMADNSPSADSDHHMDMTSNDALMKENTPLTSTSSTSNITNNPDIDYPMRDIMKYDNLSTGENMEEFNRYEESRNELMKLKFGGNHNNNGKEQDREDAPLSKDDPAAASSLNYTTTTPCSSDPEVTTTSIPSEYLSTNSNDNTNLPYKLTIADLPQFSRVETQIKIQLSVSPAPPQFLLHLPRDTIAKPKLTLESTTVPESIQPHMLYLDTFVVGNSTQNDKNSEGLGYSPRVNSISKEEAISPNAAAAEEDDKKLRSCNVCKRCMRRELKRASRRKAGIADDFSNWNLEIPKRAIIFNCKEVISFPRPTGSNDSNEKSVELLSRIICYCRHHQEPNGFRLLFVLKDYNNKILGKTLSDPIMIMDRKKSGKGEGNISEQQLNKPRGIETLPQHQVKFSPLSIDESSSDFTSASAPINNSQLSHNEDIRPTKRKRAWSPADSTAGVNSSSTYYGSISQQRVPSVTTPSMPNLSVKKEPISPLTDSLSPTNHFGSTSATSVSSTTPEKRNSTSHAQIAEVLSQQPTLAQQKQATLPSIQRIIPAQGPIRGGIEVTLLGSNFRPGLSVKFGANSSLATHCWSDSTIVTYLPPASQAGPVLVTFEENTDDGAGLLATSTHQIFTYTDDSDRQLIELALQIVGLKMNGKLEDAKNIAKRIIGNSNSNEGGDQQQQQQQQQENTSNKHMTSSDHYEGWIAEAAMTMQELSSSDLDEESILLNFFQMLKLPNSPITTPNWAVCTLEGHTMLHLACIKGYKRLCKFLLKNGSKVDFRDSNDFSPLHFALINGHRDLIKLLVKFKATTNIKLKNNVFIKDICDSNVLDLLDTLPVPTSDFVSNERNSSDAMIGVKHDIPRRPSTDSFESMYDDDDDEYSAFQPTFMNINKSGLKNTDFFVEDDDRDDDRYYEDEADDEGDFDLSGSYLDSEFVGTSRDKKLHPNTQDSIIEEMVIKNEIKNQATGFELWKRMKKAFGTFNSSSPKLDTQVGELSESDAATVIASPVQRTQNAAVNGAVVNGEDVLPAYDDLFPQDSSLRSLINFTGHDAEAQSNKSKQDQTQKAATTGAATTSVTDSTEEGELVISLKSQMSWNSDKRLLFFWFPFMLLLILILLGNEFNLIQIENFSTFKATIVTARDRVGAMMLGNDRFTNLLNDNFNYGRQRVGNLLNDVNDAVMTAVVGRV